MIFRKPNSHTLLYRSLGSFRHCAALKLEVNMQRRRRAGGAALRVTCHWMTAARRTAQPKAYPPPLQAVFDNPEGCRFGRWCTNMLPRELLADRAVGSGTVAIRSNVSWSVVYPQDTQA
jgi:hypothetical protein